MTDEIPAREKTLLDEFLALDAGDHCRAELIDGEVVVTPPPGGRHERVISRIMEQVYVQSKFRMDMSGHKGLRLPGAGGLPDNHVIPDLVLALRESDLFHPAGSWMPPEGVAMVVEVTSSRPELDRQAKRRVYARAGIPLYLLVDRDKGFVSLFSDPEGENYTELAQPFGKPVSLPEPFGFDLDTGDFD
ncbi:MAG TPA: Uma2 family endonuclease [Yinghuangia sp.]|uniref:Uma2 family endonuclease n=1 Tax=Yinghuangia sp. YIM S10712 TaxID=3436930 RepID=UPI002C60C6FD|nr:Uma2 family endonuclease [Yinghuangia sp.]